MRERARKRKGSEGEEEGEKRVRKRRGSRTRLDCTSTILYLVGGRAVSDMNMNTLSVSQ